MTVEIKVFVKRSGNFRKLVEDFQREVIAGMVDKALDASPVDTSAYVDSFGFNDPQGFSSRGRPRGQESGAAKERNKQRLSQEISSLDLSARVVFGNSAPHAGAVENGGHNWSGANLDGHKVFAQTRREFGRLAKEALAKVGTQ